MEVGINNWYQRPSLSGICNAALNIAEFVILHERNLTSN
jgi:hypothetical protein